MSNLRWGSRTLISNQVKGAIDLIGHHDVVAVHGSLPLTDVTLNWGRDPGRLDDTDTVELIN